MFHNNGQKKGDFCYVLSKACRVTGLGYSDRMSIEYVNKWKGEFKPGPTIYDFRRTAVRNLVRSGVTKNIVMKITGHKTRAVFDRYDIVTAEEIKNRDRKTVSRNTLFLPLKV